MIPLSEGLRASGEIPVDTLGQDLSEKKWAFWNQDLSIDRFPNDLPPAKRVKLPMHPEDSSDIQPTGIGWLAKWVHVPDSLAGERAFLTIGKNYGAWTLYLDSLEIGSVGKVGQDPQQEERKYKRSFPLEFLYRRSGDRLLLLRFSDQHWKKEIDAYPEQRNYGPAYIDHDISQKNDRILYLFKVSTGLGVIGGCLLALGIVHLLIFLFYPKRKGNLHYVFFTWALAFMVLSNVLFQASDDPVLRLNEWSYISYGAYIFMFSLLTVVYSFLRRKGFGKVFWSILLGGGLLIFLIEWFLIGRIYTAVILLAVFVECLRVIFISIRHKERGSWTLGMGAGVFILIPMVIVILQILLGGFDIKGLEGFALIAVTVLSFPISMSVYLAHDFASTSKGLEQKLQEVEELNRKNLEQEREKQRILEEKKEELEEKVQERTAELQERKEEIEDAHREITDSINYAQRIQEALLPEEERYQVLPEHFILFRPRDPVSGDFHWGKQDGEHFYLAAVDCTGHGVPGGFMSMLGVSYLNEILASESGLLPGEFLTRLKEKVVTDLAGGKGVQAKDGMDMALLRFGPKNANGDREVCFAGAQNPLYIIRKGIVDAPPELESLRGERAVNEKVIKPFRDSSDGLEIQADKEGIGSGEHRVDRFRTVRFHARQEDALYIFSDGYADQFGGPKGKKFRYGPFKRLLVDLEDKPMEEQKAELERQFEEWKGDREQVDDVIVIGVRV